MEKGERRRAKEVKKKRKKETILKISKISYTKFFRVELNISPLPYKKKIRVRDFRNPVL